MSNYVHGWTRNILTVAAIATLLSGCLTKEEGAGFLDGQQIGSSGGAPPQISGVPTNSVIAGQNYSFIPTASDPDGDTLTFSVSGLPSWASFNTASGEISGTPQPGSIGTFVDIVIGVSDGQLSASLAPFSVSVEAIGTGSAVLDWTPPTENNDGSTLVDLAGYIVYWGTQSGSYSNSATIDNASVSTYVVENLSPGSYEFVVTAINTSGAESMFSNIVTTQIL